MNKCKTIISALAVGLLFFSTAAFAGGMRCGMHTISDGGRNGPGKYEILKKCGQPTQSYGNIWIYDRPGHSDKKVLSFDDQGLLINIK